MLLVLRLCVQNGALLRAGHGHICTEDIASCTRALPVGILCKLYAQILDGATPRDHLEVELAGAVLLCVPELNVGEVGDVSTLHASSTH